MTEENKNMGLLSSEMHRGPFGWDDESIVGFIGTREEGTSTVGINATEHQRLMADRMTKAAEKVARYLTGAAVAALSLMTHEQFAQILHKFSNTRFPH